MRKYVLYIHIPILVICMTSCEGFFESTVQIEPPGFTEQMAIHAVGSTASNRLFVHVTRTTSFIEDPPMYDANGILIPGPSDRISNATVTLWMDNELISELEEQDDPQDFNYTTPKDALTFIKGATYRLEIKAGEFPTAEGFATIPEDVIPTRVRFELDGGSDFDDSYSAIDLTFQDNPSQSDYYEMRAVRATNNGGKWLYDREFTDSFDPAIERGISNLISNDISYDGEIKNIELTIWERPNVDANGDLYLLWRVTSEGHYLYNKTARTQDDSEDNPFASPVQVYSNIENGVGIFSIVNEQFIKVE